MARMLLWPPFRGRPSASVVQFNLFFYGYRVNFGYRYFGQLWITPPNIHTCLSLENLEHFLSPSQSILLWTIFEVEALHKGFPHRCLELDMAFMQGKSSRDDFWAPWRDESEFCGNVRMGHSIGNMYTIYTHHLYDSMP